MKNSKQVMQTLMAITIFFFMALASTTPRRTYSKPVTYPCVHYAPLTYSPILLKINITSNYTMKDINAARESDPSTIMEELRALNYSYQLADGVRPNLALTVTYTNDGYNHFGVSLYVDWQGQSSFTITLPTNYITIRQLIHDMAAELNRWVTNGWHSGNCD